MGGVCSYCWALVHSRSEKDVKQGLGWAETLLADPHLPQSRQHECCYYIAVAKYKLGKQACESVGIVLHIVLQTAQLTCCTCRQAHRGQEPATDLAAGLPSKLACSSSAADCA